MKETRLSKNEKKIFAGSRMQPEGLGKLGQGGQGSIIYYGVLLYVAKSRIKLGVRMKFRNEWHGMN